MLLMEDLSAEAAVSEGGSGEGRSIVDDDPDAAEDVDYFPGMDEEEEPEEEDEVEEEDEGLSEEDSGSDGSEADFRAAEDEDDDTPSAAETADVSFRAYAEHRQILELELPSQLVKRSKQAVNCFQRAEAYHVAIAVATSTATADAPHPRCGRKGSTPVMDRWKAAMKSLPLADGRAHQKWADDTELRQNGKGLVMSALHAEK